MLFTVAKTTAFVAVCVSCSLLLFCFLCAVWKHFILHAHTKDHPGTVRIMLWQKCRLGGRVGKIGWYGNPCYVKTCNVNPSPVFHVWHYSYMISIDLYQLYSCSQDLLCCKSIYMRKNYYSFLLQPSTSFCLKGFVGPVLELGWYSPKHSTRTST